MSTKKPFSKDILHIENIEQVCSEIISKLKYDVVKTLQRRGAVVGISGGIDSSVTMALAAKAFGPKNVLGVMLPEQDSSGDSEMLAKKLADKFGVDTLVENITGALEGFGCYRRRDEAISRIVTNFDPKVDKAKIEIKQEIETNLPPAFSC
jgi:NAD+ synthase